MRSATAAGRLSVGDPVDVAAATGAITVFYILAGTAILPRLWADPLGPMWKIWPILAFNFACLAILEDR